MELAAFIILCLIGLIIHLPPAVSIGLFVIFILGIKYVLSSNSREAEKYLSEPYVQNALKFIDFYELLPLDKPHLLFITPQTISIKISDDDLGVSLETYLSMCSSEPENTSLFWEWFLKRSKTALGGERGISYFNKLPLQVKLHNNDNDYPVIYMYQPCHSDGKREQYVSAIKNQYKKIYGKNLDIAHFYEEY